ncbi:universal stress protein [Streptomyces sp. BE303]|uniref:universal stress protein n=1 Tax=Streptomyces sp. BE303 TaxID=3002528 RepID=UPI002E79981B|nr:universal stress protein [Streptomyces sp. BE303]MED7955092.1 universal stress protein [Streptomyces sp. BE303]
MTHAPTLEGPVSGPIVVGFDGSPESVAATGWGAREALLRGLPLVLVQAWPWPNTDVLGTDDAISWSREQLAAKEAELRAVLASGAEITSAHVREDPAEALEAAGRNATMLVLGSRGLSTVRGFLVGSVSQEVLRRASCPVVLVRAEADEQATASPDAADDGDVVLGLDLRHPCDDVIAFAFDAAGLRSVQLRIVHAWAPPISSEYTALAAVESMYGELSALEQRQLTDTLAPWRSRCPRVTVNTAFVHDNAAAGVVEAAAGAGLLVVGRRIRRSPIGAHVGPVAHAAIHHVQCPVAVVSYG